jgi:hypothetical protein
LTSKKKVQISEIPRFLKSRLNNCWKGQTWREALRCCRLESETLWNLIFMLLLKGLWFVTYYVMVDPLNWHQTPLFFIIWLVDRFYFSNVSTRITSGAPSSSFKISPILFKHVQFLNTWLVMHRLMRVITRLTLVFSVPSLL